MRTPLVHERPSLVRLMRPLYSLVHAHRDEYAGVATSGPDDVTVMVVGASRFGEAAGRADEVAKA